MKNLKNITLVALFAVVSLSSCKKENKEEEVPTTFTCTTCSKTPDAKAENNTIAKGIYKGVIIGSTGTVKLDVANGGTTVGGIMVIDGVTVNLTTTIAWVAGQPYTAAFTGTLNGASVSITFSVGAEGGTPTITASTIPGHAGASFLLFKETSTALIEGYEGTYSTTLPETGTFNIVLSRSSNIYGLMVRKTGSTDVKYTSGTLANGKLYDSKGNMVVTLTGDQLYNQFVDGNGKTVTVTGKRSL